MSCMATSGGCERHRTDPFVNHLNGTEGSRYRHEACLDRLHWDSPQPEALYVDPGRCGMVAAMPLLPRRHIRQEVPDGSPRGEPGWSPRHASEAEVASARRSVGETR